MKDILDKAIEITTTQYIDLVNPEFIGQSRLKDDGTYWIVFKQSDVLYKVHFFC